MKKYACFKYRELLGETAHIIAEVEEIENINNKSDKTQQILDIMSGKGLIARKMYVIRSIPIENTFPAWLFNSIRFEEIESEYGKVIGATHIHTGTTNYKFEAIIEKGDLPVIEAENFESAKLYFEVNK